MSFCGISSGSELFEKIRIKKLSVNKGLHVNFAHVNYVCKIKRRTFKQCQLFE